MQRFLAPAFVLALACLTLAGCGDDYVVLPKDTTTTRPVPTTATQARTQVLICVPGQVAQIGSDGLYHCVTRPTSN